MADKVKAVELYSLSAASANPGAQTYLGCGILFARTDIVVCGSGCLSGWPMAVVCVYQDGLWQWFDDILIDTHSHKLRFGVGHRPTVVSHAAW